MTLRKRLAGFTLTEVMIALAMTALLLIGISKIFALTSNTISAGQAMAKAMRSQRAVQQTLAADLVGTGANLGDATYSSGMLPLVNTVDIDYSSPFLSISNFRVAAYKNATEMAASPFAIADPPGPSPYTALDTTQFAARSLAIRGIDINKDGTQDTNNFLPPPSGTNGETVPLYLYGERNFRTDTLGFFTHGRFASQTGSDSSFQSGLTANESFVWYGQLRVFNSQGSRLDITNAYGCPGDLLTPDSSAVTSSPPTRPLPNRNNRFADQFRLGRVQSLLAPAIIGNGRVYSDSQNTTQNDNAVNAAGVFVGNDPSQPVRFVQRNWRAPDYIGTSIRPSMTPFDLGSSVQYWTNGISQQVYSDDRLSGATPAHNASAPGLTAASIRTDVVGVDVKRAKRRIDFVQNRDLTLPLTTAFQAYWWENIPASWTGRYWVNPFPRASQFVDTTDTTTAGVLANQQINAKSLAQRQQLLADSCSQFIVEFAGDFVTQQNDTTSGGIIGTVLSGAPDGVLDFVYVNGVKQTKWYGMPRDVDGDGVIPGYQNGARINSPDVTTVTDFASNSGVITDVFAVSTPLRANPTPTKPVSRAAGITDDQYARTLGPSLLYTFEKSLPPLPPVTTNFATAIAEPTGAVDASTGSYTCIWGTREFSKGTTVSLPDGTTKIVYPVPQLIRILADIRDPDGKLKEALTQEYVFPVRVTGAVKPPVTSN